MPRGGKRHVQPGVFATVIKAFLSSQKFESMAPGTQYYVRRLLQLAESPDGLGGVPVEELRPALVQAFLDGLADKPASQENARKSLRMLERWAIVRDLLPGPITIGTELVGRDGGHEPWPEQSVSFAEANCVQHLSYAVTLAANTGQRGSDLVRMRWTDIENHDGHPGINVRQQKTGLKLWVPFTQELIRKIDTWKRRPGFILLKRDGQPFGDRHQLSNHWLDERQKPGMEPIRHLTMHGLRATAVVRLRRANVEPTLIANFVGMSVPMVERYCRFSDQRENALAALRILEGNIVSFPQDKTLKS